MVCQTNQASLPNILSRTNEITADCLEPLLREFAKNYKHPLGVWGSDCSAPTSRCYHYTFENNVYVHRDSVPAAAIKFPVTVCTKGKTKVNDLEVPEYIKITQCGNKDSCKPFFASKGVLFASKGVLFASKGVLFASKGVLSAQTTCSIEYSQVCGNLDVRLQKKKTAKSCVSF